MKRKLLALFLCFITLVCMLASCGSKKNENSVYYLNFKPEVAEVYERIGNRRYAQCCNSGVKHL